MDVVRVLAAVLLLGNVHFVDDGSGEVIANGNTELESVAELLGITFESLFRGITTRTHSETSRGNTQLIQTNCDANTVGPPLDWIDTSRSTCTDDVSPSHSDSR